MTVHTSLRGKRALVTGAGRNLGKAIALELARRGADTVINVGSNQEEAERVATEARAFGARSLAVVADVSHPQQVNEMVEQAARTLDGVDILVNNAAIRPGQALLDITDDDWDRVIGVNLSGAFYCARAVAPLMMRQGFGRIINISSIGAFRGDPMRVHVVACKAAILGLTRSLTLALAPYNVSVNTVAPGSFLTQKKWRPEWSAEERIKDVPLGRIGEPEEVAALCAFLASNEAAYITGQTIHINGGWYFG